MIAPGSQSGASLVETKLKVGGAGQCQVFARAIRTGSTARLARSGEDSFQRVDYGMLINEDAKMGERERGEG